MDKLEYNRRRVIHLAKKYAENKECPQCRSSKKDWKIVPVFEFGDPEMPSQVVIYCNKCGKYNETFAQAPDEQARAYAEETMKLKKAGARRATPEEADKLIKKI